MISACGSGKNPSRTPNGSMTGSTIRRSIQSSPAWIFTTFNTHTIRWLPGHTEWLVNGALVRSTTAALADDPMPVRLNFWAPAASWADAYDAALMPAASAASNSSSYYDVDYVTVSSIPEPSGALMTLLVFAWALRRRADHKNG
jgi:beta-glucanase (GH16 family)